MYKCMQTLIVFPTPEMEFGVLMVLLFLPIIVRLGIHSVDINAACTIEINTTVMYNIFRGTYRDPLKS